jgi:hypothetical protein
LARGEAQAGGNRTKQNGKSGKPGQVGAKAACNEPGEAVSGALGKRGLGMSAIAASRKDRAQLAMIAALAQKPKLDKHDLSELQRALEAGWLSLEEAAALFQLEAAMTLKCAGWVDFFTAALTDHIVWQSRPTGVLDNEQAAWLLAQDDRAQTLGSLALLENSVAEAQRTLPASFVEAVQARIRSRSSGVKLPSALRAAA